MDPFGHLYISEGPADEDVQRLRDRFDQADASERRDLERRMTALADAEAAGAAIRRLMSRNEGD